MLLGGVGASGTIRVALGVSGGVRDVLRTGRECRYSGPEGV